MNNNDSTIIDTKLIELDSNRKTYKKNNTVPSKIRRPSLFIKKSPNSNKDNDKNNKNKNKHESKKKLEMMYYLSDKIYGSTSWKKYVNEISPSLLKDLLDVDKYSSIVYQSDTKPMDDLNNQQDRNLKVSELFTKAYCDLKIASQINGWNYRRTEIARHWDNHLAYLYVVNYYMMFSLKSRESKWSWILIVFSSICSILTIINSEDQLLVKFVRYTLSFLAVCTSLVAAFIKKENYVERIKELDRYTQKVGKINVEIDNVIKQKPWNRMPHSAFIDKYQNETTALLAAPPPMSPYEFKSTVYQLTKYYPELIINTFPWYVKKKFGDIEYYEMTDWGEKILLSYNRYSCFGQYSKKCSCFYSCSNCCKDKSSVFYHYKQYNECILHTLHSERVKKENIAKQAIDNEFSDSDSDRTNIV